MRSINYFTPGGGSCGITIYLVRFMWIRSDSWLYLCYTIDISTYSHKVKYQVDQISRLNKYNTRGHHVDTYEL